MSFAHIHAIRTTHHRTGFHFSLFHRRTFPAQWCPMPNGIANENKTNTLKKPVDSFSIMVEKHSIAYWKFRKRVATLTLPHFSIGYSLACGSFRFLKIKIVWLKVAKEFVEIVWSIHIWAREIWCDPVHHQNHAMTNRKVHSIFSPCTPLTAQNSQFLVHHITEFHYDSIWLSFFPPIFRLHRLLVHAVQL